MASNHEFGPERRRCLRQMVHAPAFASFDGVSGGMILDLSEEGLAMQLGPCAGGGGFDTHGLEKDRQVRLELDLTEPYAHVETTGYIAWADALGRAGVRFSDLPEEARQRLKQWLTVNAAAPSHIAPKVALGRRWGWDRGEKLDGRSQEHMSISLEAEPAVVENGTAGIGGNGIAGNATGASPAPGSGAKSNGNRAGASATVQYEFNSLGTDLAATLRLIAERARALTRGSSAAIALAHKGGVICRASVGESAPALGTRINLNSGLSGRCFRTGKTVRCDDTEHDSRVDLESCRWLGVRSILAAPVRYERDTWGLLMVFAPAPFNFDEGDVAVVESLAHTVVRSMRQLEEIGRHG